MWPTHDMSTAARSAIPEAFSSAGSIAADAASAAFQTARAVANFETAHGRASAFASLPTFHAAIAAIADIADAKVAWISIAQDVGRIEGMDEALALKSMLSDRLWLQFAEGPIISRWTALNRTLSEVGGDWQVWSEWYGRRFAGDTTSFAGLSAAQDEELCVSIALKDKAFWDRDALEVNRDIRAMLDAARAKPPAQNPSTETFGVGADGIIGRSEVKAGDHLGGAKAQVDMYLEFLKSFKILDSCSANEKGDALRAQCDDLREILTLEIESVNYHLLWPRFHRLRITLKRHRKAKSAKEYSPYLLDDDIVYSLQDVVQNGNILIVNQSKLIDKEKQAQGPDLDGDDGAFADIRTVITESAANPDVTNDEAAKDVAIAVEATTPPTEDVEGILGKQEGKKIQRNFMIVLMERFKSSAKIAKDAALSEGAKKSADLIIENRGPIMEFFATQGDAAMDWITSVFEHL